MHKSTTNRDFANNPAAGIVSRAELGKRVLVNGHFGGILRYLGLVDGKQGIYCGIELDQPLGKNDGTHEGVFYFECRPGHGIFAPCHKVQMMKKGEPKKGNDQSGSATMYDNQQKVPMMSRSAIPTLQQQSTTGDAATDKRGEEEEEDKEWRMATALLASSAESAPQQIVMMNHPGPPQPPQSMEWSLMSMSTGSTNSDGAAGLMTKFDEDLMAHSQATYTVFDSDCMMLSDLELSESALLRLDEEDEESVRTTEWMAMNLMGPPYHSSRLSESVILEGPSMGSISHLPMVGSPEPEETPTPMAAETDFVSGLISKQMLMMLGEEDRRNRNHLVLNPLQMMEETIKADGIKASPVEGEKGANNNNSIATSSNDVFNGGKTAVKENNNNNESDIRQQQQKNNTNNNNKHRKQLQCPNNSLSLSKQQLLLDTTSKKRIELLDTRNNIKEKKIRVSVFESIPIPTQNLSAAARAKPKQLSKTQLVMEQLKASMEAAKQRTKKEIQATKTSIASTTIQMNKKTSELATKNSNNATASSSTPNIPRSLSRQVLNSKENTVFTQPLLKKPNASTTCRTILPKKSNSNELVNIKTSGKFVDKTSKSNCKNVQIQVDTLTQKLTKTKILGEKNKNLADVFMILSNYLNNQITIADKQINFLKEHLIRNSAECAMHLQQSELVWQNKLRQNEEQYNQQIDQLRIIIQNSHEEEIQDIRRKNQHIVDQLNMQLESLQTCLEEQTRKHEFELQENENERIKRLNNELESRQYELQLKNQELDNLRKKNRELQYEAEKLSEKDNQIIKIEKRNTDLLEQVNRLKQIEKRLLTQLEEYRLSLNESMARTKEFAIEKEILEYHLQEKGNLDQSSPSTPLLKQNSNKINREFNPGSSISEVVNFRTPDQRRKSSDRPNSSCTSQGALVRASFDDGMSRSVDSALSNSIINCYRIEGKTKSHDTTTKIYTPREFYEVREQTTAKRAVSFENSEQDCAVSQKLTE